MSEMRRDSGWFYDLPVVSHLGLTIKFPTPETMEHEAISHQDQRDFHDPNCTQTRSRRCSLGTPGPCHTALYNHDVMYKRLKIQLLSHIPCVWSQRRYLLRVYLKAIKSDKTGSKDRAHDELRRKPRIRRLIGYLMSTMGLQKTQLENHTTSLLFASSFQLQHF